MERRDIWGQGVWCAQPEAEVENPQVAQAHALARATAGRAAQSLRRIRTREKGHRDL